MSLPTQYQEYIHLSRYARYDEEKQRRETWGETVDRLAGFWSEQLGAALGAKTYTAVFNAVYDLEIMPSMRTMMTAGPALKRDHVAAYNCSYTPIDKPQRLDEIMYILMCGTGVGFSVERQYINELPLVPKVYESDSTIVVRDSKLGWATAYRQLITLLFSGAIPKWDDSRVRPAGARLRTFGGRASGPEPLRLLYRYTVEAFKRAEGRKFNSLEIHDLVCKIADTIVVGGVRRSALISLSNLSDPRMRDAKSGEWWEKHAERGLANNSVAYTEKPDMGIFMEEWHALYKSQSGERGIFSRPAAVEQALRSGRRAPADFGTNPCSEIILRPQQFCNLTEVVVRSTDTMASLKRKVRLATILGTMQATLTNFRYLSPEWEKNTEEERLLGVSLTGVMDHPVLGATGNTSVRWLESLKEVAIKTNKTWAKRLGIPQSTAITCVKPSGTVSQLVNSASGIHPRYAPYYIRRVRADATDPLAYAMQIQGIPCETDRHRPNTLVFSFPVKAPANAVVRDERSAIEQLELWKMYQLHWCEHKPSITVFVKENEWMEVGAWVYKNFDLMSGIALLPYDGGTYEQAPYEEISKEEYNKLVVALPTINWTFNEESDNTTGSQELACIGNQCEL